MRIAAGALNSADAGTAVPLRPGAECGMVQPPITPRVPASPPFTPPPLSPSPCSTMKRALQERVMLLVKQKRVAGGSGGWAFPHAQHKEGETVRSAAERALRETVGLVPAYWVGNAPMAHLPLGGKDGGDAMYFMLAQVGSSEGGGTSHVLAHHMVLRWEASNAGALILPRHMHVALPASPPRRAPLPPASAPGHLTPLHPVVHRS